MIMKTFQYVITDEVGIHARPAGLLVKEAKEFQSELILSANGKEANLTKIMAIMSLGVKQGTEVTVSANGEDEDAAIAAIEKFFKENL